MTSTTRLLSIAGLGALLAAFGCASTPTPAPAIEKAKPTPVANTAPQAELIMPEPGAPQLMPIYFDTDRALLGEEARQTLKRYARAIQEHPEWGIVTIEGHCDERGSDEYNVALGDRRADAVARYLTDLGVPARRLETLTYGEARPAVIGHDEAAWRENRRAEIEAEAQDSARR